LTVGSAKTTHGTAMLVFSNKNQGTTGTSKNGYIRISEAIPTEGVQGDWWAIVQVA